MTHDMDFSSLRPKIRKLLKRVFSDPDLDEFCQDYFFEEVYKKFSRGQGKQEKLNVLLGYCSSRSRLKMLVEAMHQCQEPQFMAFFQAKGIVIGVDSVHNRTVPSYQIASAHKFDLINQVDDCLNMLWGQKGLVGFVIPCSSPALLQNLGERLKYELGRNRVRLMRTLEINPIRMSIDRAIWTIKKQYGPAVRERNVLFTVRIPNEEMANRFWPRLQQAFMNKKLQTRIIVILALPSGSVWSDTTLVALEEPHFKIADIYRWVRTVVSRLEWPDDLFEEWIEQIMAECSYNGELQIELVYTHLDDMVDLLQKNPTLDQFRQELKQREQFYDE